MWLRRILNSAVLWALMKDTSCRRHQGGKTCAICKNRSLTSEHKLEDTWMLTTTRAAQLPVLTLNIPLTRPPFSLRSPPPLFSSLSSSQSSTSILYTNIYPGRKELTWFQLCFSRLLYRIQTLYDLSLFLKGKENAVLSLHLRLQNTKRRWVTQDDGDQSELGTSY